MEEALRNDEIRKNCLSAWGRATTQARTTSLDVSSELQRARGIRGQQAQHEAMGIRYARSIHGQRTHFNDRGSVPLIWINDQESRITVRLSPPNLENKKSMDRLQVTENVTREGLELVPTGDHAKTYPMSNELLAESSDARAYRMWEVSARMMNLLQERSVTPLPRVERGKPLPTGKIIDLSETTIAEGDALYVLLGYLGI